MKRCMLVLACALLLPVAAAAQEQTDPFDIVVDVENEQDKTAVFNLANTFALLAPATIGQRRPSRLDFRSGLGLVQNGAATAKLSSVLPETLGASVARLESMRETCDISRHRFTDTDVLLVVHSSTGDLQQDVFRCFVAGLWIYHAGGQETVNMENWRVPYARILGSVAGGRPAFAGFETGEN